MSVLDNFEKKMETAMNKAFSKLSSKEVKPADFSVALKKELDSNANSISAERTVTPNRFHVKLSTEDFDKVEKWGSEAFADELVVDLAKYAKTQQYIFIGPVSIIFEEDVSFQKGDFHITSESIRGTIKPDESEIKSRVSLDVNGRKYALGKEITVIGRDASNDIVLDDSSVSRKHLEIRVTPAGTIATDLGSTNGTLVENKKMSAVTLVNGNIITVGRSKIVYIEE
jgi:hypothetical protein